MALYMLDTNIVSRLMRGHATVADHVTSVSMDDLSVSAITAGELRFGIAKRPQATGLLRLVREFLRRVDVLPWTGEVAETYGTLRASLERDGRSLSPLDTLIAAHAMAAGAVLVTNDQAFAQLPGLALADWTM